MSTTKRSLEYLTEEQIAKFHKDGYLCVRGFLSGEQTEMLLARSKQLLKDVDLTSHPRTKFTTGDRDHIGDDYFLNSGDKIRFFLEENVINEDGTFNRPKEEAPLRLDLFSSALHELDPVFRRITLENDRLKTLVRDLHFHEDPRVLQSMVICKQRELGGEGGVYFFTAVLDLTTLAVPEHNDSTFLYTDPPSALGFWFALEKCTAYNGALSFLPGSHLTVPITKRFVRNPGGGTTFEPLNVGPYCPPKGEYILETCEPGDLVLIHGSVLHKSERNTSASTRFAYTFHMIEGPQKAIYDKKNWLQPSSEMPFSRLYATT